MDWITVLQIFNILYILTGIVILQKMLKAGKIDTSKTKGNFAYSLGLYTCIVCFCPIFFAAHRISEFRRKIR